MISALAFTAIAAFIAALVCIFTIPERASMDRDGARAMLGLLLFIVAAIAAAAAVIVWLLSLIA